MRNKLLVAPLAGAWIEISAFRGSRLSIASLPSRERGLKLDNKFKVGAAKESLPSRERGLKSHDRENRKRDLQSLPSRERGLKYGYGQKRNVRGAVAPLAGAWIEIERIF